MSQYSYTYIEDGSVVGASGLNTNLEEVRDAINNLTVLSMMSGMFNYFHASTLINPGGAAPPLEANGHHGDHRYSFSVFAGSMSYTPTTDFGADGGTETTGSYTGTRTIIGHPDATGPYVGAGGPLCKIVLPLGIAVGGGAPDYVNAIIISLDVEIVDYNRESCEEVMLCLQAQCDNGTWYTITNSERFVTMADKTRPQGTEDHEHIVSIRTRITQNTVDFDFIPIGPGDITGIRGMVSLVSAASVSDQVTLGNWNLSILPMHMEEV